MYNLIKRKVEGAKKEIIGFASQLVKCPSPSFEEEKIASIIAETMRNLAYDKVICDEMGNIAGVIYGREAGPSLLINAHMDVAETDKEKWDFDLCAGNILNDRLIGIGASDCKSGLAAAVYAGAILRKSILPLKGNFIVAATVAEEAGGSCGVRYLMEKTIPQLGIKPSFAILAEPTNLSLYRGHSGWASFEIIVQGADPFAVNDAAECIFAELKKNRLTTAENSESEDCKVEKPVFAANNGFRRGIIAVRKRISKNEDISAASQNLLAETSYISSSVSHGINVEVALPKTERKVYTNRTVVAETKIEAWSIDPYHPLIERSRQVLAAMDEKFSVGKWKLPRAGMGTAGGVLSKEFNIPTIGYGPGIEENCHVPNESVPVENIMKATSGLAAISYGLIGVPVCGWTTDEI